jgi:hypothetical protein
MKSFSTINLVSLFAILIVLGYLYRRFENKRLNDASQDNYNAIQNYLLDDVTLAKSKKPILWIHVPYEYNSRKWLSFGSRSSFDLNQPYLYLTVKSILRQCDQSFTVCIIDDNSFEKLIPNWSINMTSITDPILANMRMLGLMNLIHIYGGLLCPMSFVCMKNLNGLYHKGTINDKMFVCENNNNNVTSTTHDFYPDLAFCGAKKNNKTVGELIDFIQRTNSRDFTAENEFLGNYDRWVNTRIQRGDINLISGVDVGIKNVDDKPIKLEELMSNNYLDIYPQSYGIWIPADQLLKRRQYEWFTRLSHKEVLESNTIIGNYLLLYNSPDAKAGDILEPLEDKPNWVGFWKTPNYPGLYGLKPDHLGDGVQKVPYTGR